MGLAMVALVSFGCATTSIESLAPAAPSSSLDPEPWAPEPGDNARTGEPTAVAIAGGEQQAQAVALRVLEAIRDADDRLLNRMLEARISRLQPRPSAAQVPREALVEASIRSPRRGSLGPQSPLSEYFQLDQMRMQPLSVVMPQVPNGLEGSDILVYIPLTRAGRTIFRFLVPGWSHRGSVLVRTGVDPRVVGL